MIKNIRIVAMFRSVNAAVIIIGAFLCVCGAVFSASAQRSSPSSSSSGGKLRPAQIKERALQVNTGCAASYTRFAMPSRKLFLDATAQYGNIVAGHLGGGYQIFPKTFALLSYHQSRQEYDANFIVPFCRDCNFVFHGLWLGLGRELYAPIKSGIGLFGGVHALIGTEFFANNGYVSQSTSSHILNPAFKPQIIAGVYVQRVDFFVGVKHYFWLPQAMTIQRNPLYDELSTEPLIWDKDLFPGRGGLGYFLGIRYSLF